MSGISGRINVGTVGEDRCVLCGKHLTKTAKVFCSQRCRDKCIRVEGDTRGLDGEVQILMAQFRDGGWKGWEWPS